MPCHVKFLSCLHGRVRGGRGLYAGAHDCARAHGRCQDEGLKGAGARGLRGAWARHKAGRAHSIGQGTEGACGACLRPSWPIVLGVILPLILPGIHDLEIRSEV